MPSPDKRSRLVSGRARSGPDRSRPSTPPFVAANPAQVSSPLGARPPTLRMGRHWSAVVAPGRAEGPGQRSVTWRIQHMERIERREFLKLAGAGVGAVVLSSLFYDQLFAGMILKPGEELFASRFGVTKEIMRKVLDGGPLQGGRLRRALLRIQARQRVVMEDDIIKESSEDITLGVGIRVLNGKQTGFAYTRDLSAREMRQAALTAAAIAASGATVPRAGDQGVQPGRQVYIMAEPVRARRRSADKIALVKEAYAAAQAHDKRITKVSASLADELQYVTIVNSEGLLVSDARPQARLRSAPPPRRTASATPGSRQRGRPRRHGLLPGRHDAEGDRRRRRPRRPSCCCRPSNPSPGEQPVVLGNDESGVMIHEAVGHPLEADGNWKKTSIMWDKLGQMVASPIVTIYDDATIPHYRGSLNVDDEGTPTGKAMLIEKGTLVGFLHDRLSARILRVTPNGHGRRESFTLHAHPAHGQHRAGARRGDARGHHQLGQERILRRDAIRADRSRTPASSPSP